MCDSALTYWLGPPGYRSANARMAATMLALVPLVVALKVWDRVMPWSRDDARRKAVGRG
jgi:hypothetical protein